MYDYYSDYDGENEEQCALTGFQHDPYEGYGECDLSDSGRNMFGFVQPVNSDGSFSRHGDVPDVIDSSTPFTTHYFFEK